MNVPLPFWAKIRGPNTNYLVESSSFQEKLVLCPLILTNFTFFNPSWNHLYK